MAIIGEFNYRRVRCILLVFNVHTEGMGLEMRLEVYYDMTV